MSNKLDDSSFTDAKLKAVAKKWFNKGKKKSRRQPNIERSGRGNLKKLF